MLQIKNFKVPSTYLQIQSRLISSTTIAIHKPNVSAAAYQPKLVEKGKYENWEKNNIFKAETPRSKPRFTMVLPPPNITGNLHLGHALACTVQDVIVRHQRSLGKNVLWLPGTDHAGIATQGVVEKYIKSKKDISRHDLGQQKFIQEVWKWKEKHGDIICKQLKTLGCSLDWSRQVFTLDRQHTHAVNAAFINLFKKGLIYRKKALVNWCNALKSTVSDIEVDSITVNGAREISIPGYEKPIKFGLMYYFAYRLYDSDEEVVVATTMPETMLGDTAVAVHPDDERYKHLKGRRVWHPFRNTTIPIVVDDFVDMEFGTGAVKITPAHSKLDYQISKSQNLQLLQVIDEDGLMQNAERYNKMKRYECREKLVNKLDEMGLLRKIKDHHMIIPICSRTGDVIDQLPKEQWFIACSELNERTGELVDTGKLKIKPDKFVQQWRNWTTDYRDWCISRQLWWGHRIPAYKCSVDRDVVWIAATDEDAAKTEASKYLRTLPDCITAERDTDVLDTWFSSGIYPFAALGWPSSYHHKDYNHFYPLNLMVTGHDILGFWVHRMVILGLELTGQLPFNQVLLHGIICDSKGAKMSKSRGNVIDPTDVINGISLEGLKDKTKEMHRNGILSIEELDKALAYHQTNFANTKGIPECGVDALRFTLLSNDIKSHYVNFDVAMCFANKLFCNKIWQSVKYAQLSFGKLEILDEAININHLTYFDKWILSRLAHMVETVNTSMENYDYHLATKAIRTLIYNEFCDIYIEATKPGFDGSDAKTGYAHAHTLSAVLNTSLRCLAPFMVYLTDELIPKIPSFKTNIIHNFKDSSNKYLDFPKHSDFKTWQDENFEKQVNKLLGTVYLIREVKALYNISNKLRPAVYINTHNNTLISDIDKNKRFFLNIARCSDVIFKSNPDKKYVTASLDKDTTVNVELLGEDIEIAVFAAKMKLDKKIRKLKDSLSKLEAKFESVYYLKNAPECTQLSDKERLITKKKELEELQKLM